MAKWRENLYAKNREQERVVIPDEAINCLYDYKIKTELQERRKRKR